MVGKKAVRLLNLPTLCRLDAPLISASPQFSQRLQLIPSYIFVLSAHFFIGPVFPVPSTSFVSMASLHSILNFSTLSHPAPYMQSFFHFQVRVDPLSSVPLACFEVTHLNSPIQERRYSSGETEGGRRGEGGGGDGESLA